MVRDIIIASSSDKVRAQLRGFVAEMGIMGVIECRSASQTLDFAQRLPSAIIICHRLTDMAPAAMLRLLPPGADMILLISSAQSPLFGKERSFAEKKQRNQRKVQNFCGYTGKTQSAMT